MNRLSRKSAPGVPGKKGHHGEGDENAQFCSRIGCSGRIKYTQNVKIGTSFRTSDGNGTVKRSSTSGSLIPKPEKSGVGSKMKLPLQSRHGQSTTKSELMSSTSSSTENKPEGLGKVVVSEKRITGSNHLKPGSVKPLSASGSSGLHPPSNGVRGGSHSQEPHSSGKKLKKKINSSSEPSLPSVVDRMTITSSARNNASTSSSRMRPSSRLNDRSSSCGGKTSRERARVGGQSLSSPSSSRSYSLSRSNRVSPSTTVALSRGAAQYRPLTGGEFSQQYDITGAAEILLALERIEQDEELTHEQVLALEMSLFLTGLTLYDRYRDMRLDIDDMSYEELLALGERMGTVSTPLSEDELSKCLNRSIHQGTLQNGCDGDDDVNAKCSICQEEYASGDVIGTISDCRHRYHEMCIKQWLRLKNWCPICKASAAPSHSSSYQ